MSPKSSGEDEREGFEPFSVGECPLILVRAIGATACIFFAAIFHLALGNSGTFPDVPAMSQSHIDVRYVANLARLELSEAEIAVFQPQLEAILANVAELSELDVTGIDPTAHSSPIFGRMRDDEPHESLPPSALLQNAPDQAQGQVRVPKVVADA